jgi:long-subunit fatty acid transport protein
MSKIIVTLGLTVLAFASYGQSAFKQNHDFGMAFSYAPKEVNLSLAWKQMHGITANQKFKMGYGLRFNGYLSNDKDYITAPAYLTSGEKGPQVLFIENIQENIDTLSLHNAQHNSVNAVVYLEYDFSSKWGIGFNIDAAGIAFGGSREGKMISSNRPNDISEVVKAKPTPYNVLLVSDNDIGMLNSELYATYNFNKKLSVNVGFTFMFTEYTTTQKISYNDNNDRFRHKSLMGMMSVNFKPFNK